MKIVRKKFLIVLLFIGLGFFSFPFPAYALGPLALIGIGIAAIGLGSLFGMVPGLGGIVGWIGTGFGKVIAAVIIGCLSGLLAIPAILLQWSIDPWFIKYGYTSGGVIDVGWPVVRDLANMLIVLALVVIGLATALRLEEYQARKTLPILIGVALLINFTPVIMGVIVDFANIIMNFFLEGFLGPVIISNNFSNMMGALTTKNVFDVTFWIELTFMGIFAIVAGILFLCFALLFIIRRVAMWILVILSPIAFVAYILPPTRGFFRFWWHQFFQWTIIGVFSAFFLWLGNHMIDLASRPDFSASIEVGGDIQEMMNALAPFLVALIFLFIGFFVSLSTSAMGASGVIAGFQGFTKTAGAWVRREARERGPAWAREKIAESEPAKKIAQRLVEAKAPEEIKIFGKKVPVVSQVAKWGAAASVTAGRVIGRAHPAIVEAERRAIEQAETAGKGKRVEENLAVMRMPGVTKAEKIGRINAMILDGRIDEAIEKGLTMKEIQEAMRSAAKHGKEMTMARALPNIAANVLREPGENYQQALERIYKKIRPQDVQYMSRKQFDLLTAAGNPDPDMRQMFQQTFLKNIYGEHLGAIAMHHPMEAPKIQEALNEQGRPWLEANAPRLVRYLTRTPGRAAMLFELPPPTRTRP